jgi:hypothetical protein
MLVLTLPFSIGSIHGSFTMIRDKRRLIGYALFVNFVAFTIKSKNRHLDFHEF